MGVAPKSKYKNNKKKKNASYYDNVDENETFLMTQTVGSPRYMSPECAKKEPYNLKTDVYSYGLLFHQIVTLEKPYDDIDDDDHDTCVFYEHVRPVIPDELPKRTKQMLFRSWAPIIEFRPNMNQICSYLKEDRYDVIKSGTPPSLSTIVAKMEEEKSMNKKKTKSFSSSSSSSTILLLSPSMSYVASCKFASLSDCNVVKNNKTKKKNNNNSKIKNSSSSPKKNKRSIIPSTIRQMFGVGGGRNNNDQPPQQLQLEKKNLPQQNHSSGHFAPPVATRAANAKAA